MAKRNWTKAEYELLRTTGNVPGRSRRAIHRVKLRLGLCDKCEPRLPWTDQSVAQLLSLMDQGYTPTQIEEQKLLPFTRMAIQKKLCRLGLTKPCPMQKLPMEWRERLKQFLRNSWEGKTPADLAELWNKTYPTRAVKTKLIASYLQRLHIKISHGEVKRIQHQRKREQKLWEKHRKESPANALEQIRLSRARFMRSRLDRNRDIWTGLSIPEEVLLEK